MRSVSCGERVLDGCKGSAELSDLLADDFRLFGVQQEARYQTDPGGAEESRPPGRKKHERCGAKGRSDPAGAGAAGVLADRSAGALGPKRRGPTCSRLKSGHLEGW